ncbi:Antifreeze protein, type I [Sulfitobacter noctilucicola]|uniref:Antifreeze protein n=1 Tax=Sulfitobacter noctilucicola TaxID=1342301 RepID=A0A7W6M9W4_9RHOB|nr:hypothetical protein [Sulfitobacter noctilucicola]KIN63331.1 Antifreeze protein, type I [Sulfitobacter noctilucicola]MBB4175151.1 hypothetical protein [Sulfitobacter noctilucicola]
MTPTDLFALQLRLGTLFIETQAVMSLRLLAMGGVIPSHPGENTRMVSEKGPAMTKAFAAATQAMMEGKRPEQIMSAAITPVSKRVRSNRKRLSK